MSCALQYFLNISDQSPLQIHRSRTLQLRESHLLAHLYQISHWMFYCIKAPTESRFLRSSWKRAIALLGYTSKGIPISRAKFISLDILLAQLSILTAYVVKESDRMTLRLETLCDSGRQLKSERLFTAKIRRPHLTSMFPIFTVSGLLLAYSRC